MLSRRKCLCFPTFNTLSFGNWVLTECWMAWWVLRYESNDETWPRGTIDRANGFISMICALFLWYGFILQYTIWHFCGMCHIFNGKLTQTKKTYWYVNYGFVNITQDESSLFWGFVKQNLITQFSNTSPGQQQSIPFIQKLYDLWPFYQTLLQAHTTKSNRPQDCFLL